MLKHLKIGLLGFLVLVYISGSIGFFINPSFFKPFTWFTLIITCLVFLIHQPVNQPKYLLSFLCLAAFGFSMELLGIDTGMIFGTYHYGNSLGPKFEEVPIIISLNWALLINSGVLLAGYFFEHRLATAFLAAILVVLIDVCMEHIAPLMDMWYFEGGMAGIHNYIGWFCIAFPTSYILHDTFKQGNKKVALVIITLQLLTFGSVYLSKLLNFT